MKRIKASDAKQKFGALLDQARTAPVTITSHGRPVAVMVPYDDYERDEARKLERLQARLAAAGAGGKALTTDELVASLGLAEPAE